MNLNSPLNEVNALHLSVIWNNLNFCSHYSQEKMQ